MLKCFLMLKLIHSLHGSSITLQLSSTFQSIEMKTFFTWLLVAALLITAHPKKVQKCYELITRCPKILEPCPPQSKCEENTTISLRGKGCCCLPECPRNETFLEEPHIAADPTCDQPDAFPAGIVSSLPGCYCQSGFVRNKLQKCIKADDCPQPSKKCKRNEMYSDCGPTESPTCDNPNPSLNMGVGASILPAVCIKGCFCNIGFVRDKNNKCIKASKCPEPECGANEVFMSCYRNCAEPTCDNPSSYPCNGPCKQGCYCENGFVRNSQKKCVKIGDCGHTEL